MTCSFLRHTLNQASTTTLATEDLPDEVRQLRARLLEKEQRILEQEERIEQLEQQLEQFKRYLFGRRSERVHHDPNQELLFGEQSSDEQSAAEPPQTEVSGHKRRKRGHGGGRGPLPDHLPRRRIEHHPPAEECTCAECGTPKQVIGEEVSEELEYTPGSFHVNQHVRVKMACRHCQGQVSIGPLPKRPIDKGIPGPGLLAHVVSSKYADHLPLNRQEKIFRRHGLSIPRSTLCGWVAFVAMLLEPIVSAMRDEVLKSKKIHTDDTPIPVQDSDSDKRRTHRGYIWVYIGDQNDVVFDYTRTRNRDGPVNFLDDYEGYLQADALGIYDDIYLAGDVIEVACWAHARRYFHDALDSDPERAREMLERIARLYAVERRATARSLDDDKLREWRQRFSLPRLERIRERLDEWSLFVLPKSPLGKAIAYALNNWSALKRYTEEGFLSIDNNLSERTIRDLVIGRKNWLFAGSEAGAQRAAIIFSLVASCKLHGIDPYHYLEDVLSRIHEHPKDKIRELIPRIWKQRHQPQAAAQSEAQSSDA